MARSRGRSGGFSRPAAKPAPRSFSSASTRPQTPPPPAPHAPAPPPAPHTAGGGMLSGLGGMVAQGMALGTGSALAHRAVDSVFSSSHPEPAQAQQAAQEIVHSPQEPCQSQAKIFMDCMTYNNGDMGSCQHYFDSLQSCRLNLA